MSYVLFRFIPMEEKIKSVQLLFPVYYIEIYPNLQHMYFHSLTIFVDMPGISSILSRMASIICALFIDSISLPLTGATLLWMGSTCLCHFVREINIHLFRSHWNLVCSLSCVSKRSLLAALSTTARASYTFLAQSDRFRTHTVIY